MKLKFDSGIEYEIAAINSVTDLFEGLSQEQRRSRDSANSKKIVLD